MLRPQDPRKAGAPSRPQGKSDLRWTLIYGPSGDQGGAVFARREEASGCVQFPFAGSRNRASIRRE